MVSWDVSEIPVDISRELAVLTDCAPPREEARGGEFSLQYHHHYGCSMYGMLIKWSGYKTANNKTANLQNSEKQNGEQQNSE